MSRMKLARKAAVALAVAAVFLGGLATAFVQAASLEIVHELGTTQVPKAPERVVVFDFGILETLDELGVPVVGVPQANLPSHLAKYRDAAYRNVGTLKDPDFETIHDLRPDLIIISGRQAEFYEELSRLAPTVYMGVDNANYLASFKHNIRTLARMFAMEDAVEGRLADIDAHIERVRQHTAGKKALMLLVTGGKASTYGPGSRYGMIYDVMGLEPAVENVVASTHGQSISWEFVIMADPDFILVIDRDAVVSGGGNQPAQQVVENALVKRTRAFQAGNIKYLDPTYWYLSGGGLTSFVRMLSDVEEAVR